MEETRNRRLCVWALKRSRLPIRVLLSFLPPFKNSFLINITCSSDSFFFAFDFLASLSLTQFRLYPFIFFFFFLFHFCSSREMQVILSQDIYILYNAIVTRRRSIYIKRRRIRRKEKTRARECNISLQKFLKRALLFVSLGILFTLLFSFCISRMRERTRELSPCVLYYI